MVLQAQLNDHISHGANKRMGWHYFEFCHNIHCYCFNSLLLVVKDYKINTFANALKATSLLNICALKLNILHLPVMNISKSEAYILSVNCHFLSLANRINSLHTHPSDLIINLVDVNMRCEIRREKCEVSTLGRVFNSRLVRFD